MQYHHIDYAALRAFCIQVFQGYGFGMLCEICTAILSGGTTSNYIYKTPGKSNICHFFMAVDYGVFGDKAQMEQSLSVFMQELRDSKKAEGQNRIFTHGEKEFDSRQKVMAQGVSLNEKTYKEMQMIAQYTGAEVPPYRD